MSDLVYDDEKSDSQQAPSGGLVFDDDLADKAANFGKGALEVGKGALETLNAPLQVAGEAIRGAGESEPLRVATADNQRGFRAPSIVQDLFPSLKTDQPPSDPLEKTYQGLEGLANLPLGVQAASDAVKAPPDIAAHLGGLGLGLGLIPPAGELAKGAETATAAQEAETAANEAKAAGASLPEMAPGATTGEPHALFAYNDKMGPEGSSRAIYNVFGDPEHPAVKTVGHGSSVPIDVLEKNGIPITGQQPGAVTKFGAPVSETPLERIVGKEIPGEPPSRLPPDPNAPKPPPAAAPSKDPLQDVKDFLQRTQGKIEAKPGIGTKARNYIKNEVGDLRAKDMGVRDPMIRSLDPKHPIEALRKAEDLMSYAANKGYFKAGLSDAARRDAIESTISQTGKNIGAVRAVGSQRAAAPVAEVRDAIKNSLNAEYGGKASREIKTVLGDYDRMTKQDPSFEGLSKVASYLNGEKRTFNKIGQNEGPTIDAANIIGKMNNESLRKVLTPEEDKFYTQNLRDFGAHKKLETIVGSSGRRAMTGRGAPGGALSTIWQQLWDRGGYRAAGIVADKMARSTKPLNTLPEFFEELAHHAGDEVEDTINGMAQGGIVPADVRNYVMAKR